MTLNLTHWFTNLILWIFTVALGLLENLSFPKLKLLLQIWYEKRFQSTNSNTFAYLPASNAVDDNKVIKNALGWSWEE